MDTEKVISDLNKRFAQPLPPITSAGSSSGWMKTGSMRTSWMILNWRMPSWCS